MTRLLPVPVEPGAGAMHLVDQLEAALTTPGTLVLPYPAGHPDPTGATDAPLDLPAGSVLAIGTSGSTGPAKRAILTADALLASVRATHERLGGPGQWLLTLPGYHIAGLQVLLRSRLAGADAVIMDLAGGFTPEAFAAAVPGLSGARRFTSVVPTQLHRLLESPAAVEALGSFDAVLVGGAALDPRLAQRARDHDIPVVTTYGMSETCGGCVYDGIALPGVHLDLAETESDGSHTGRNRSHTQPDSSPPGLERYPPAGQIRIGGSVVGSGYLRLDGPAPAVTATPSHLTGPFTIDETGCRWFTTDDLGFVSDTGQLTVAGRVDDVILTGGLKVWPAVVEAALAASLPAATQIAVIDLPDPQWGSIVAAAMVWRGPGQPPALEELRDRLRDLLPRHALPRHLALVPSLPLLATGKIDRDQLRRLVAAQIEG